MRQTRKEWSEGQKIIERNKIRRGVKKYKVSEKVGKLLNKWITQKIMKKLG